MAAAVATPVDEEALPPTMNSGDEGGVVGADGEAPAAFAGGTGGVSGEATLAVAGAFAEDLAFAGGGKGSLY